MAERLYRGQRSHPVPVWNGVLEHRKRIDAAIWVFLWLLDAISKEKDGIGLVHGGAPVKVTTIAKTLKFDDWTVRMHLKQLEEGGYIKRIRTPYGYVIHVLNSRKFGIWTWHKRSGVSPQSESERSGVLQRQTVGKPTQRPWENPRNKEDAVNNAATRQNTQLSKAAREDRERRDQILTIERYLKNPNLTIEETEHLKAKLESLRGTL